MPEIFSETPPEQPGEKGPPEVQELQQQVAQLRQAMEIMAPTVQKIHTDRDMQGYAAGIQDNAEKLPLLARDPSYGATLVQQKLNEAEAYARSMGKSTMQLDKAKQVDLLAGAMLAAENECRSTLTKFGVDPATLPASQQPAQAPPSQPGTAADDQDQQEFPKGKHPAMYKITPDGRMVETLTGKPVGQTPYGSVETLPTDVPGPAAPGTPVGATQPQPNKPVRYTREDMVADLRQRANELRGTQ
jgi:hypothetical protein